MLNTESQIQYSAILDFIYPVGSYFITESANYDTIEKVQAHFGGTWVKVQGKYLLGATDGSVQQELIDLGYSRSDNGYHYWTDSAGNKHSITPGSEYYSDVGGEATHTLTKGEMPYHNHQLLRYLDTGSAYSAGYGTGNHTGILSETATTAFIPSMWTSYVGGSQPHNNMPPYRTVHMYRRTA